MIIHSSIDWAMTTALQNVLERGSFSAPREKKIKELLGQSITFDMQYPIVTKQARDIGYQFYPAEAYWILTGDNRLENITRYSPFIWTFSDDGVYYQGAYGPKIVDQLSYVCDALTSDHDTRQAVINIWRENPRPSRDIPCTLSYQFIARGTELHCIQSMRSSDVWLGYPYDAFNATMLTAYIILLLRHRKTIYNRPGHADWANSLTLGNHTLCVGSQHLYEPQWDKAIDVIADETEVKYPPFSVDNFTSPNALLTWLDKRRHSARGVDPR